MYTIVVSNEYPQSMFWSKNKKKGIPCIPQFFYIKVGFNGVYIYFFFFFFFFFFFQLPYGNPFNLPVKWYTQGRGGPSLCGPYKLHGSLICIFNRK